MLLWINFSWNNKNHKIDGDIKYSYEGWYNCLIMNSWILDLSKTVIETRRCSCIGSCSLIIFPTLCKRIKWVATWNVFHWKMIVEFDEGVNYLEVMKEVLKNCKKVESDCEIFYE